MNLRCFKLSISILVCASLAACVTPTNVSQITKTAPVAAAPRFASGTKAVVIKTARLAAGGSFPNAYVLPAATPIPTNFPGGDGAAAYLPGVSATTYYAPDGTTLSSAPSWLLDTQLGVTGLVGAANTCATFGTAGAYDIQNYYRTSEVDCAPANDGAGTRVDPVFMRILLNRDTSLIGTAENLMVQIEYQASGIFYGSKGNSAVVDNNVDQIWRMFWSNSLTSTFNPFAIVVPPNYSACDPDNSAVNTCLGTYGGAATKTRQFIIPLSAYPNLSVIQISRIKSNAAAYIGTYCTGVTAHDSPLCLGVVVHSITLMRF